MICIGYLSPGLRIFLVRRNTSQHQFLYVHPAGVPWMGGEMLPPSHSGRDGSADSTAAEEMSFLTHPAISGGGVLLIHCIS